MKSLIFSATIVLAFGLSLPYASQAQGTTYLSNLGDTSAGSYAVGSDSWLAASFFTGSNPSGYVLNSIELSMNDAIGTPSGVTVMLYSIALGSSFPGSSLATLSGSPNPSTAGVYTFTAPENLILHFGYFIVISADTPVASGSYEWNYSNANSYNPADGWGIPTSTPFVVHGSSGWNPVSGIHPLFAVNATPVPEPSVLALLALGGMWLFGFRSKGLLNRPTVYRVVKSAAELP